jgi:hypothetical protein
MTKGKYTIEVRKKRTFLREEVPTRCRCWWCCWYDAARRTAYEKEHGDG